MRFYDSRIKEIVGIEQFLIILEKLKKESENIVLTSGTFDLLHIGHAQYLQKAKDLGDVLVVGLDSDLKVKKRKGPERPIVPEEERASLLSFVRPVDFIVIKDVDDDSMELMKIVNPDVLVISETTGHDGDRIGRMSQYCGQITILEPQSTTSTTAKVRRLFVDGAKEFAKGLSKKIGGIIEESLHEFQGSK